MNKKNILLLTANFILLVIILFINAGEPKALKQLFSWKTSEADAIELSYFGGKVNLEKADGIWTVGSENYETDNEVVEAFLDKLNNTKLLETVSYKKDYESYNVSDADNYIAVSGKGKEFFKLIIGGEDVRATFSYARRGDEDGVYSISQNLTRDVKRDENSFRNKVVAAAEVNAITEINVTAGDNYRIAVINSTLDSDELYKRTWQLASDPTMFLDQTKVQGLVNQFSDIRAEGFLNSAAGLVPFWSVEYLEGINKVVLTIYDKGEGYSYPCTVSTSNYVFLLSAAEAESIMIPLYSLVGAPAE